MHKPRLFANWKDFDPFDQGTLNPKWEDDENDCGSNLKTLSLVQKDSRSLYADKRIPRNLVMGNSMC